MSTPNKNTPITAVIGNRRTRFISDDPEKITELKKLFRYHKPDYELTTGYQEVLLEIERRKRQNKKRPAEDHLALDPEAVARDIRGWDGWTHMLQRGGVATGLYLAVRPPGLVERDERSYPKYMLCDTSSLSKRQYQTEAVVKMMSASNTGGILLGATGTGKTRIAGNYSRMLNGFCCFVVDELTLLEQARKELAKTIKEPVGIVGRGKFHPERVTCATIQTLHKHRNKLEFRKWFKSIDVFMIDELHVQLNKRSLDVLQIAKPLAVFGLTATLELEKPHVAMPAYALTGPVIFRYTLQEGVAEGVLTKGTVERITITQVDDSPRENPHTAYLRLIALSVKRNDAIIRAATHWVRKGKRVGVLVERLAHIRKLSSLLSRAGYKHAALSGADSTTTERRAAIAQIESGELNLFIATRIFSKGVNIKRVDVLIDGSASPGSNVTQQRYGRGVRKVKGKDRLLYIDIGDSGNRYAKATAARTVALAKLGLAIKEIKCP